jgi:membrane-associated protease RseP (regulator of RpoE activity)
MRRLFALGLTIFVAGSAAAQTEVIIRRPGEKDQVIHLDSTRSREALAKVRTGIEQATTELQQHMKEFRGDLGNLRLRELDTEPFRVNTLALRNGELAAERALAPMMRGFRAAMRQPHLGIGIDTRPRESDKYGAYITSVTPGSPADKAGIISGDIVVRIAGKSLTDKDAKDDSGPGIRLISIISTLTVGKPVDVELRRGTQNKTVKVTPNDEDSGMMARTAPSVAELSRLPADRLNQTWAYGGDMSMPRAAAPMAPSFSIFSNGSGDFGYSFGSNGLFAAYELAPVNEKLGAYFGTTEGVLVVNTVANRGFDDAAPVIATAPRAGSMGRMSRDTASARAGRMMCDTSAVPNGTTISCHGGSAGGVAIDVEGVPMQSGFRLRKTAINIGLEPGDVIVSVDGRKVTNPSQLMRIVGTYDHSDEFKLQIMRQKHAETLTVKMP